LGFGFSTDLTPTKRPNSWIAPSQWNNEEIVKERMCRMVAVLTDESCISDEEKSPWTQAVGKPFRFEK
jgi:hypothetical protein